MNAESVPEVSPRSPRVSPNSKMELKVIEHSACGISPRPMPKDNDPSQPNDHPSQSVVCDFNSTPHLSVQPSFPQNISQDQRKFPPQLEDVVRVCGDSSASSENIQQHSQADRPQHEVAFGNGRIPSPNRVDPVRNSRPLNLRFAQNVKQHYLSLLNWLLMLLFAIFLCYYFYEVLVVVDPHVGKLQPDPANTNFIVAVLAQVFGGLMVAVYLEILNLLHLQRLSRPRGALMLEAGQLSATALGTARILFTPGRHHIWTLLRIALPISVIVLGTVQKFGAGVIYEIIPYNGTIPVWGGLTAMNSTVLDFLPTSTMAVYFLSWTPNLLSVPQFILKLPATDQCADNCVTYMQPGGVDIPRLRDNSSQTLLDTGRFESADAIQIYNAPAIVTEFDLPPSDLVFGTDDCQFFTPISNDAINICIKPTESGAVIGWTICPSAVYFNSSCTSNLSWTGAIGQATTVTTYTQLATTSYYYQNLSIINLKPKSERVPLPINIDGFKSTWAKLFNPGNDTSPIPNPFMVNALQFELGFYLRLEMDDFPNDQQSPLQILRNFITVPLQFSTTALLYMNATIAGFDLPDDMQATASAAMGRWRWKAQLRTVALWIGIAGALVVSSGAMILWVLFQDPVAVESTAFPSIDSIWRAGPGCKFSHSKTPLADLVHEEEFSKKNTRGKINFFRKKRGYLICARCETHKSSHSAFVVGEEEV